MDNPNSLPQLTLPTVPDDFNGGVGVPFARALFLLLQGATVTIGDTSGTEPIEISTLQQQIEDLTTKVNDSFRKQRKILMNGVDNAEMSVPFQSIGTSDYEVTCSILIPTGANPADGAGLYPIKDSFQPSQFRVRCDGVLSSYQLLFVVTTIYQTDVSA